MKQRPETYLRATSQENGQQGPTSAVTTAAENLSKTEAANHRNLPYISIFKFYDAPFQKNIPIITSMLHSISIFLLPIFLLYILTSTPISATPTFIYAYCPNTTLFTTNSEYHSNLNSLLSFLLSNGTHENGFYSTSAGGADSTSTVHGLFLCRRDDTTTTCNECVQTAAKKLTQECPNRKKAVIWYLECLINYSNESFYGELESQPDESSLLLLYKTESVSNNAAEFYQVLGRTLNKLTSAAASALDKFATEKANVSSSVTIYALGQCTQDLSTRDCNRCLKECVGNISQSGVNSQGVIVFSPSCNVWYDTDPFFNTSKVPIASPPSAPPTAPFGASPPRTTPTPLARGKGSNTTKVPTIIVVTILIFIAIDVLIFYFLWRRRRSRKNKEAMKKSEDEDEIGRFSSLEYNFSTIKAATLNFSNENKLGHGGFGVVYQGTLPNGQEIAVKRLARNSGQGEIEFKNEVLLAAKLQHRNLVRFLGFCLEEEEKLLIFELVPNRSLDYFLFDATRRVLLDWEKRYKIIGEVARGLLYLHEDSRLRIIHRDLKASNILLDSKMSAKIADFGMARLFHVDQTDANTKRIVGTYGYMAPEYAFHGLFSVKSDVYSFGVLILEIICGQRNNGLHIGENVENLITYVWRNWNEETTLDVVDPTILNGSRIEIMRCIHIGLLCVQESVAKRPTMSLVTLMLSSQSISLPKPSEPAFISLFSDRPLVESGSTSKQQTMNEFSMTEEFGPR